MSSWILREFLRVIELLRAVQENSLVYSKQKKNTYTGSTRNLNLYSVLGNSKGRSSVRVTQAVACDRSAALALGIKLFLRKLVLLPPHFQIIPKSCDLLLIVPCLFPTYLGRMFSRDYGDSFMAPVRPNSLSREHVQADKCPTPWRQHSARRTKRNRISC
jgi:hypothetical protein